MGEKNNLKTPENMGNLRNGPDNRRSGDRNQNKGNRSKPMMQGQGNLEHFRKEVVSGAPTYDISFKEKGKDDKKFTGRCRLFVGNIPQNIAEDALKKLFEKHGQVAEVFLGKNNAFAFIKMDTRHNAEAARDALDSYSYEGRTLRVRLAAHAAAIRVKNLSPNVSNELLEYAFSYFGDVERAIVITDDRGRSTGEGIVEFARKSAAQAALKKCSQECFMLTSIPTPVDVEPFDQKDEDEGLTEKHLNRNSEFLQEREVGPRFADHGTFEHDFGMRWKHLFELEKQKRERLENEIREDRTLLSEQMECARVEHQTSILREQLRQMEERTNQFSSARTNQMEEERRRDEERKRKEAHMRQQTDELIRFNKTPNRDFGSLRRAENELRSKASALQNILDRQEQTMRQATAGVGNGAPEPIFGNRMNVPPMNEMVGRNGPSGHIPPFQNNIMFDPELVGHGSLGGPPMGGPRGPMPGDMGPGPGQFAGGQQRIDRPFNPGMNKRRRY